jgi:hypothetical protein
VQHRRERRLVVEISVAELRENRMQLLGRSPDVDDDAVGVQVRALERRVDDIGRAVELLRRPERLSSQAVSDQHVAPDGHAEHGTTPCRR